VDRRSTKLLSIFHRLTAAATLNARNPQVFGVTLARISHKLTVMIRLRSLFLLVPLALIQVACSGSSSAPPPDNIDSSGNSVSAVPWNKPENWETQGQLGNAMQQ
jgi:hypothetical protein